MTDEALERGLSRLLSSGTWVASAVVGAGLVVPGGTSLVRAGVGLFIALPVARLFVMLVAYVRRRDYGIGIVTALVLAVIALGVWIGARS